MNSTTTSAPTFTYRLPVTYVRVTGGRHESTDPCGKGPRVSYQATVTTELGADLRTRQLVRASAQAMAEKKYAWSFTSDGRLAGSEVGATSHPSARLEAAVRMGAGLAGIAGPALLAAGPPGWVGLAAVAGLGAGIGALSVGRPGPSPAEADASLPDRTASLRANGGTEETDGRLGLVTFNPPPAGIPEFCSADPAAEGVPACYVTACPQAAQTLADYRASVRAAAGLHARLVLGLATGGGDAEAARSVHTVERLLASIELGAAKAERTFDAWCQTRRKVTSELFDERMPVDTLPTSADLEDWVKQSGGGPAAEPQPWHGLVRKLQVGVAVDLDPEDVLGAQRKPKIANEDVFSDDHVVYRHPRRAVLKVYKVAPDDDGSLTAVLVEIRRLQVFCPGTEVDVSLSGEKGSHSLAITFEESGALAKVASDITDVALQRAQATGGLLTAASEAVTSGETIRKALAPASLTEQLAEYKAAKELGLLPSADDPLADLKTQLEEARLRAQLNLADQVAKSDSVPVFVQF